jgi:hypothetical protein
LAEAGGHLTSFHEMHDDSETQKWGGP